MGEYAEMMLDGTCCASCGDYLGFDDGFPMYCRGCQPEPVKKIKLVKVNKVKVKKTVRCTHPGCNKFFVDMNSVRQHLRHFHKVIGAFSGG